MAASPIGIVLDMVILVIDNTIGTVLSIFGLFGDLLASMMGVSSTGGTLGIVLFFVVLGLVGFFVFKLFVGALKTIGMLVVAVLAILAFIAIGLGLV
ncbi:MAG: hypothetical protein JW789_04055 [Candidatus Aenigmarchaeota archaeon]|nr:hypothetical protein [Candidatus Aenigmarchaeota archaeon]